MMLDPGPEENTDPDDDWADAPHNVQNVRFDIRGRAHYVVYISTDAHRLQVSISPQGRSIRVWLDGIPMQEEPPELHKRLAGGY